MAVSCSSLVVLLPMRRYFTVERPPRHLLASAQRLPVVVRATSAPGISAGSGASENGKACYCLNLLACPICYRQLLRQSQSSFTRLECEVCKKAYIRNESYYDLTVTSGSEGHAETMPKSTELFRSSLVPYLYERGWRQAFVLSGFPGADKEFEMAKEYLRPTFGGTIVDASCGSGLFSRMFSKSDLYKCVIALDFSENMLKQCSEYVKKEGISEENLVIVRADIARLPFESNSVDAVHAGAALHCWPSPSAAVAEISRILRPGGSFVSTTFIGDGIWSIFPLSLVLQRIVSIPGVHLFKSEAELEDLFRACGFDGLTCVRNNLFVMMSATKPC